MYCQGLGDCFLLSFPGAKDSDRPVYVMIDCGVIVGTEDAQARMTRVVEDIAAQTGGKIDLLVVTHEHWDHVSGFVQAKQVFEEKLEFQNVWLAWTEKIGNPIADTLRAEHKKKLKKLRAALAQIAPGLTASEGDEEDSQAAALRDDIGAARQVLDFFGPDPERGTAALRLAGVPAGAKAGSGSTTAAMNWLRDRATDFCSPGERRALPGAAGVSLYILGPPTDLTKLRKDAPSKGKNEAYELQADRVSFLGALESLAGEAEPARSPFEKHFRLPDAEARFDPFFREFYGFADDPLGDAGIPWRRIDGDWLRGASRLALQLDSDTNNTSLALAIELAGGQTLIFPGDAQIGNWQSWNDLTFEDAAGHPVRARDLLRKAVLYKVGHHGSHNATLKEGGLEEMTGADLVAMIPVNEVMAHKKRPPKDGWKMPFDPLYTRLKELTLGRVLRADRGPEDLTKAEAAAPEGTKGKWDEFLKLVKFSDEKFPQDGQPLFVEYTIPP
jgi:hypothetical protein